MQLISGRTPTQVEREFDSGATVRHWIAEREAWWTTQGFAPVDWILQSRAYDDHDVGTTPGFEGDTARALAA
ncbi:hypothetical protein, partial [Salmonella enterica]|uniref:hypothetical protein n=1 Tax=Salmonella enterica TaxID=28901 RepID=UPI003CE71467